MKSWGRSLKSREVHESKLNQHEGKLQISEGLIWNSTMIKISSEQLSLYFGDRNIIFWCLNTYSSICSALQSTFSIKLSLKVCFFVPSWAHCMWRGPCPLPPLFSILLMEFDCIHFTLTSLSLFLSSCPERTMSGCEQCVRHFLGLSLESYLLLLIHCRKWNGGNRCLFYF